MGHGEAVRVIDPELGTLEREHLKDSGSKSATLSKRKSISRRESSFGESPDNFCFFAFRNFCYARYVEN